MEKEVSHINPGFRYFLKLSFDGSQYCGWQEQANAPTVQETLNQVVSTLLRESVKTVGCGRTDTGVHARLFYAHFDTGREIANPNQFLFKLNNMLPKDIAVSEITSVEAKCHSRFDAREREYQYFIHTVKDPFLFGKSWYQPYAWDLEAMNRAGEKLLNHKDFAAFCKAGGAQKTTLCKMMTAQWTREGHQLVFTVRADRFLRNMVRAIVGTMKEVGLGKMTPEEFDQVIRSGSRSEAGVSVPAHGLYMTDVVYPEGFFS
jgi:tRNA pseudouridine38-40 synthase